MKTISIEFLQDIDLFAQLYIYTDVLAYDILKTLYSTRGFSKRTDLKDIYFSTIDKDTFKKRVDALLKYKLIYLDQEYNSCLLLTSKSLTILQKRNIKNKIPSSVLCDSSLIEQRFLLKLYRDFSYSIISKESDFINLDIEYYIANFNQDFNKLDIFLSALQKNNIHFINFNTIAINSLSIFDLYIRLKDFANFDMYLDDINTIILNSEYIETLTENDIFKLNNITKKHSSIYNENIKYILL